MSRTIKNKRFWELWEAGQFEEVRQELKDVNQKVNNLTDGVKGMRVEIRETQETAGFAARKVLHHEKELRKLKAQ